MISEGSKFGIDTLAASAPATLANAEAATALGTKPLFWGRYFYAPGQMNSSGKKDSHYSAAENALLRSKGIKLMPLARQTKHVKRDAALGVADAKLNVDAIFECFPATYLTGADPRVLVYLDVESTDPLTTEYYSGWAKTLMAYSQAHSGGLVHFLPAIYTGVKDDKTWTALRAATLLGAPCFGAWLARYYYKSPAAKPWSDSLATPAVAPPCPLLAWQYWGSPDKAPLNENFDTSVINPAHEDVLLNGLIMPPP